MEGEGVKSKAMEEEDNTCGIVVGQCYNVINHNVTQVLLGRRWVAADNFIFTILFHILSLLLFV